jgi:glycosyltransferase involved in cell wall biosynthesis
MTHPAMRIGLNLLYLIPGTVGGTEIYARNLLHALAAIDRDNEYFVFLNREASGMALPATPNVHRVACDVRAVRRSSRYRWEQLVLPRRLRELQIDVVHSPGYVAPLFSACPSVVTIPDLNYRSIARYFPIRKRLLLPVLRFLTSQSARRARTVITISHFSRQELTRVLGLPPEKVVMTHLGPRLDAGTPAGTSTSDVRQRYNLPARYIVAFGGTSLHKNIARLVSAFKQLANQHPHDLVLLGHIPENVDLRAETTGEIARRIVSPGYVPDEHIVPILANAELFVLPSLYEGFGLPVLEAQQAGVAVACSTAGSLPEVAGNGATYFDPLSVDGMAAAIRQCLADADLREQLRERGRENLGRFNWERTARETLDVYRQAVRA